MSRNQVVALTILAPVKADRVDALRASIDALGIGPDSPLAKISGMHLGRFTIVDELYAPQNAPKPPPPGPYLLFAADIDPPEAAALAAIGAHCGEILRHCEGCPEPTDSYAFDRWLLDHRIVDGFTVMPYAGRRLGDVQHGLSLRKRIGAFAIATQGEDPSTLQAKFLEQFGDVCP